MAQVVAADQVPGRVHGEPAQRRLLVLRRDLVRAVRGQDVPQVGVLVLRIAARGAHAADHHVAQAVVRPRGQVGQAGLLPRLAHRDLQRVRLARVGVAADLEPPPVLDVPAQ